MSHLLRGQLRRTRTGRPDHLRQRDSPRPDHLRRHQILAGQVEQQRRRVMLHRPVQQELLQLFHLPATSRSGLPRQILGDLVEMVRASVRPLPVTAQRPRIQAELLGQTGHHHRWSRHHIVGYEPKPRQVESWTAIPSRSAGPRPAPGSTNATSANVNVKYRNSSSRLISGNDRNCSYCSWENIFSDTRPPPPHRTNQTERSGGDLQRSVAFDISAGRRHIRPKFLRGYGHPGRGGARPRRRPVRASTASGDSLRTLSQNMVVVRGVVRISTWADRRQTRPLAELSHLVHL
jgi:hypothetical protein